MAHKIIVGPRGGAYYLDENNEKHYVSGKQKKEALKKASKKR